MDDKKTRRFPIGREKVHYDGVDGAPVPELMDLAAEFQASTIELREANADLEMAKARAERALTRFRLLKERHESQEEGMR